MDNADDDRSDEAEVQALQTLWTRMDVQHEITKSPQIAEQADALDADTSGRRRDNVECSVFAPARPTRGSAILVQALLHRADQLLDAVEKATSIDASANRKGFAKIKTALVRGTRVSLFLEIPKVNIAKPYQQVTWLGHPVRIPYEVDIPPTVPLGPCQGTLHVMIERVPIGEVMFEICIGAQEVEQPQPALGIMGPGFSSPQKQDKGIDAVAVEAIRYTTAFISYSRKDLHQVRIFAEALDECGINLLFDLTSIEPGAEWESKIIGFIDRSDVFYVMWSKNAASSKWVDKEARTAIDRYDTSPNRRPRIRPVPLEYPLPEPPSYLKRFHFPYKWLGLVAAHSHPQVLQTPPADTNQQLNC